MGTNKGLISEAFAAFAAEAPAHAEAWMKVVRALGEASSLDPKTNELAYLSVLAALGRTSGIPFHVKSAMSKGASREDIVSALLVGLPAAGHIVTQSLPPALDVLDASE